MKCVVCNYSGGNNRNFKRHFKQKHHLNTLKRSFNCINDIYCKYCSKTFTNQSNCIRHGKTTCIYKSFIDLNKPISKTETSNQKPKNDEKDKDIQIVVLKETIKRKDLEKEIVSQKKELEKKEMEMQLKIQEKDIEILKLKHENKEHIRSKDYKLEYLNQNFNNPEDVIDVETFLENYRLEPEETEILLANYNNLGVKSYGNSLSYYFQEKYHKVYEKITGKSVKKNHVIPPIVSTDTRCRSSVIKNKQNWERDDDFNALKKIIIVSNDSIYHQQGQQILFTNEDKNKVAVIILKNNSFDKLQRMIKF